MDGDSLIIKALSSGQIETDPTTGSIYSSRIRGHVGEKTLLAGSNVKGYRIHKLCVDGERKCVRAHRIVWIDAKGPIPEGLMPDHKNRIKHDNRLENLKLVDTFGNAQNRDYDRGEDNVAAKLSWDDVRAMRSDFISGMKTKELKVKCEMSWSQVKNIIYGDSWLDPAWDAELAKVHPSRHRRESLKALGKAVVPAVVEVFGRAIMAAISTSSLTRARARDGGCEREQMERL